LDQRVAKRIRISPSERAQLNAAARSRKASVEEARRSRIILELASGKGVREVSREQRCSVNTVRLWRGRFVSDRLAGLWSRHRGKAVVEGVEQIEAQIVDWTLHKKPLDGSTQWSSRKLAKALGVSQSRVSRVWARSGLQPHRLRRYMVSDDPQFEAKAAAVIGLYLGPPSNAAVFCVDEKTAIQALDRLDPVLPLSPGRAERHGFEYYRHGTLSLYAALDTRSGEVIGKTADRHTTEEFVSFLREVVGSQPPGRRIHIIADNLSAHKTKAVRVFLEENPRVTLHYTPTYSSWLNQIEIWFSKIQRDLIARGIFTSKADLARKIMRYVRAYNKTAVPFQWTYRDPLRRIT
jgi:transposase